jgi:hypothetical protein
LNVSVLEELLFIFFVGSVKPDNGHAICHCINDQSAEIVRQFLEQPTELRLELATREEKLMFSVVVLTESTINREPLA